MKKLIKLILMAWFTIFFTNMFILFICIAFKIYSYVYLVNLNSLGWGLYFAYMYIQSQKGDQNGSSGTTDESKK